MKSATEVYLDNAAAMIPAVEVLDFYREKLQEFYANQEALHMLAYRERSALAAAGKELSLLFFNTPEYPVIWGGSATEIFHLLGAAPFFRSALLSTLEHPALTANFRDHASQFWHAGADGRIVAGKLTTAPDIVCLHQIQSELGVMQDLETLFAAVPEKSCRLADAVQAAGKLPLFSGADIAVISGVKFGAPGGAAALLRPDGRYTAKLLAHAADFRTGIYASGRISVPLMLTMVYAAKYAEKFRQENLSRLTALKQRIIDFCAPLQVMPTIPETTPASPYILNLLLPYQQSAVIVRALSESGIHAAPGSACTAESNNPSAALLAIGKSKHEAYQALRISFSGSTSSEDVDFFLAGLEKVLKNY